MSDAPKPTAKSSMFQRAILLVCGLIGIVFGVMRMYQGVNEIIGTGEAPAVRKLLEESDQAIEDANKLTKDVAPSFQAVLDSVDKDGLEATRKQKRDVALQVIEAFGAAATKARLGESKLSETEQHPVSDKFKSFLDTKIKAYEAFALACDKNQSLVKLLLDESFAKLDDLLPKFNATVAERDAAQKQADDYSAKANEIVK